MPLHLHVDCFHGNIVALFLWKQSHCFHGNSQYMLFPWQQLHCFHGNSYIVSTAIVTLFPWQELFCFQDNVFPSLGCDFNVLLVFCCTIGIECIFIHNNPQEQRHALYCNMALVVYKQMSINISLFISHSNFQLRTWEC